MDNDAANKPITTAHVYVVNQELPQLTKDVLITIYPKMFDEGVDLLDGEHHIKLDATTDPVQHTPRRVPVALRTPMKDALDGVQAEEIIEPVTKPTEWISSLVVVQNKDTNKLRICLDPKGFWVLACEIR